MSEFSNGLLDASAGLWLDPSLVSVDSGAQIGPAIDAATLVVVTPSGDILCNDDLNPLVLDPSLVLAQSASGRYAIYLGNFADRIIAPGFLVVTSRFFYCNHHARALARRASVEL